MSALANHAFVKMNGLGNEIVVVDMRTQPAAISADDARATAAVVAATGSVRGIRHGEADVVVACRCEQVVGSYSRSLCPIAEVP